MEDYLLSKGAGYEVFVPLPYYDPEIGSVPQEFRVVDSNCGDAVCAGDDPSNPNVGPHSRASCSIEHNWTPNNPLPAYLKLPTPTTTGSNDDICDFPLICKDAPTPDQAGLQGLDDRIEHPWHNNGHVQMGSVGGAGSANNAVMLNFRSPAAPIFWLWHAYVDDVWKRWECNCSQSTTLPVDLYMKDNPLVTHSERDRGEEPSFGHNHHPIYLSEDMWVRQQADGLTNHEHQNAEYYSSSSSSNYVYVQVRNRGCIASAGTETLTLHWAKAGVALSYPDSWTGALQFPGTSLPLGNIVSTITLPVIQPGSSYIAEIPWQPVDPSTYTSVNNEPHHFCLLAVIDSPHDPVDLTNQGNEKLFVEGNNNIIWKNISVVDLNPNNLVVVEDENLLDDKVMGATVVVGNAWGQSGTFDLHFSNPTIYTGNPITAEAEVKITLDEVTWQKWQTGGFQAENIEIVRPDKYQVLVSGSPAKLKNLTFAPRELALVNVGFNFLAERLSGQALFDYDVTQHRSSDGSLLGGERYHVKIPGRPGFYADAGSDKEISLGENVDLNAYDIGESAIYNWYDPEGNLLYTGKDLNVSPEITKKYKLEVIAVVDGVKDYAEVEVKVKEFEILNLSPNPSSDQVTIGYKAETASSAYLMINMPYGNSYNHILMTQQGEITVDVSSYPTGVYNVVLVCNGEVADIKTLVVQ